MKSCRHPSFRWVHDEDLGDRTVKHYRCRACGHPKKRNVKKPRYVASEKPLTRKVPPVPKLRKTLQNGTVGKRKAIKPVSDKRKVENKAYLKVRARFLETHPYCMVCFNSLSTQVHHQRGKEGQWLTDVTEFLAVCFACHERIETNREWATKQGYLKLRLTTDQLNDLP